MSTLFQQRHPPPPLDPATCAETIRRIREKNKKRLLILLVALSGGLFVGTVGYKVMGNMSLSEAFFNASMILCGMGPVDDLSNKTGAKIFASFFAIFSGAFFLIIFAFLIQSMFISTIESQRLKEECPQAA